MDHIKIIEKTPEISVNEKEYIENKLYEIFIKYYSKTEKR